MKAHAKRKRRPGRLRCAAIAAGLACGLVLGFRALLPAREPAAGTAVPAMVLPQSPAQFASAAPTPAPEESQQPLDVPFLSQTEEWPTGCESVSAVMALNDAGVDVTVTEFIEGYLPLGNAPYLGEDGEPYGCDPREKFPGDPASEDGWGCFAPVIRQAMEDLLADQEESAVVRDLTGSSLDELCQDWIARGTPVLIWASIHMDEPYEDLTFFLEDTGEPFTWIYPLHCLVLTGWDGDSYFFNDPLAGKNVAYSREATEYAYDFLGRQALAVTGA